MPGNVSELREELKEDRKEESERKGKRNKLPPSKAATFKFSYKGKEETELREVLKEEEDRKEENERKKKRNKGKNTAFARFMRTTSGSDGNNAHDVVRNILKENKLHLPEFVDQDDDDLEDGSPPFKAPKKDQEEAALEKAKRESLFDNLRDLHHFML